MAPRRERRWFHCFKKNDLRSMSPPCNASSLDAGKVLDPLSRGSLAPGDQGKGETPIRWPRGAPGSQIKSSTIKPGENMKIIGALTKQQSTVGEAGVVGQVVIQFLASRNPGAIQAMPKLQEAGMVIINIEPAQGEMFPEE